MQLERSVKPVLFLLLQPLWKAAVAQFERAIAPAEHEIAGKLKACLSDVQDSPQQVQRLLISQTEFSLRLSASCSH